jgi:hypothetical protein
LSVGELSVGESSVGESSVGQLSVGQSSFGQWSVDQLLWSQIICSTFVKYFLKKLARRNKRPIGKISPNLGPMLLFLKYFCQKIFFKTMAFFYSKQS